MHLWLTFLTIKGILILKDITSKPSTKAFSKKWKKIKFSLSELKGNFRYSLSVNGTDRYYNQNEIGFYNSKNFIQYGSRVSYHLLNKNNFLRRLESGLYIGYQTRFDSKIKNRNGFRLYTSFQTNDLWRYSFSRRGVSKRKIGMKLEQKIVLFLIPNIDNINRD